MEINIADLKLIAFYIILVNHVTVCILGITCSQNYLQG